MKCAVARNVCVIFFLLILSAENAGATTFKSISSGSWNNGPSWSGGIAPSYTCSDTIIIEHTIIFNHTLSLHGFLKIDTSGVLCGHFQLGLVYAAMENYGLIQVDTLDMDHSNTWNFYGGNIIIKDYGVLYNAGSNFYNQGGAMAVGPDFTCGGKEVGMDENYYEGKILVFPNPLSAGSSLTFHFPEYEGKGEMEISDVSGNKMARFSIRSAQFFFNTKGLAPGIYFYRFYSSVKSYSGRFVITGE